MYPDLTGIKDIKRLESFQNLQACLCLCLSCCAVLMLLPLVPYTNWCASALFAQPLAPLSWLSRCAWARPCCLPGPLLTIDMLLLQNGVIFIDRDGRHFAE